MKSLTLAAIPGRDARFVTMRTLCALRGSVVALMLGASVLSAQPTVRVQGRVFDDEVRRHGGMAAVRWVEAVRVHLVATGDTSRRITTLSDPQGRFVIEGLAPGRCTVRMARIGYGTIAWEREFDRTHDTLTVGMSPSNSADYDCPADTVLEPHFFVMLRDQDARPVTARVTVIARSDVRLDTLRPSGDAYRAAPSRAGRYVLEVTGEGFRPSRSAPFEVRWVPPRRGLCGVQLPRMLFVERVR